MDTFYAAVMQATEEAALNALVANRDMICRDGGRTPASSPAKQKSPGESRGLRDQSVPVTVSWKY